MVVVAAGADAGAEVMKRRSQDAMVVSMGRCKLESRDVWKEGTRRIRMEFERGLTRDHTALDGRLLTRDVSFDVSHRELFLSSIND